MASPGRIKQLSSQLEKHRLDAILVSHLPNIRYFCGFTGSAGLLVMSARGAEFFTDGRYSEQAAEEVDGVRVHIETGKSAQASAITWLRKRSRLKRIGFESAYMTVADRDILAKRLGRGFRLAAAPPMIDQRLMVKSAREVRKIRAACDLGDQLFRRLTKLVKPRATESQVAGKLKLAALRLAPDHMPFSTII